MALRFLCLSLTLCILSCQPETTSKPAIVVGKVDPKGASTVNLRHGTVSLAESWANQTDERDSIISLNDEGRLQVQLNLDKPQLYSFSHVRNKLEFILSPGDSVHIDLTSDTIFSGTNAAQNNHINTMNDAINQIQRFVHLQ